MDQTQAGEYRGLSAIPMIYFDRMVLQRTMEPSEWFDIAADLGLDATELHDKLLRSYEPEYLEGLRDQIHGRGLQVSQIIGAPDLTNPDTEARQQELETTYRNIDAAHILGATCVRITAGQEHEDLSHAEGVNLAVDGIRQAVEYAEDRGVYVAYENHYKDYFWSRPDFSQRTSVYLQILEGLRHTGVRVNFDCSNQVVAGEDPVELLRYVCDLVVHVHCSDRVEPNQYPHAVTGEGVVDFPTIFSLLRETNYDGWLSVEYNGTEGLDGLRRAIANVRRLWQESAA